MLEITEGELLQRLKKNIYQLFQDTDRLLNFFFQLGIYKTYGLNSRIYA